MNNTMEKTEENIIWQDVQKEQRKVSPSEDRVYDSLYEELKKSVVRPIICLHTTGRR